MAAAITIANHGNTPSPWQESTMATASLVPRQSHTPGGGMWGDLSGPKLTATTCREATPRQLLPDQTSWRKTVSTLSDRWSLEELRNQETTGDFTGDSKCLFTISSPCLLLQCVLSVSIESSRAPNPIPVKLFLNILLMKAQSTLQYPQSCPSARGEGCGVPQKAG